MTARGRAFQLTIVFGNKEFLNVSDFDESYLDLTHDNDGDHVFMGISPDLSSTISCTWKLGDDDPAENKSR